MFTSALRLPGLLTLLCGVLLVCLPARAEPLALSAGLQVEAPAGLDLTYQVVPSYDEQERVMAIWQGEALQYFIVTTRLPPQHHDAKAYLLGMARDLRTAFGGLEVGEQHTYRTAGGLAGTAVEFRKPDGNAVVTHFLTDGTASFAASAAALPAVRGQRVVDETIALFQSAVTLAPGATPARDARAEDALVGRWTVEDTLPDGRSVIVTQDLKDDLSFSAVAEADGRVVLALSGYWYRNGNALHWQYQHGEPALAKDLSGDDEIVSIAPATLVLKSRLSGKMRTFHRVEAVKL